MPLPTCTRSRGATREAEEGLPTVTGLPLSLKRFLQAGESRDAAWEAAREGGTSERRGAVRAGGLLRGLPVSAGRRSPSRRLLPAPSPCLLYLGKADARAEQRQGAGGRGQRGCRSCPWAQQLAEPQPTSPQATCQWQRLHLPTGSGSEPHGVLSKPSAGYKLTKDEVSSTELYNRAIS